MPEQNVGVELFYGGSWVNVAAIDDVLAEAPIVIKRGQSDEGSSFRPCSITCTLANDDDRYRTSNPMSPLYGKAGRNTPIRIKVGSTVRGVAEAASWTCGQTQDFRATPRRGNAWTEVEAGGALARIGQWTEPLRSPFYTFNAGLATSVGYWPMEDPRGTPKMKVVSAGDAHTDKSLGIEWDSQATFAGGGPMADLPNVSSSQGLASGFFDTGGDPTSTAGWQISFAAKFGSFGTTGSFVAPLTFETVDGTAYSIAVVDGHTLYLLADNTTSLINVNFDIAGVTDWTKVNLIILTGTYSAGTTTFSMYWMTEDSGSFAGPYTGSFSGTPSLLREWRLNAGSFPDKVAYGHFIGIRGQTDGFLGVDRASAYKGYAGEGTVERLQRLCDQKNIPLTVIGTGNGQPMGPQPVATFNEHLAEIAATEDGLIFDDIDGIGLVFMLRGARYRQTPALTLTPTDLPALPDEVTDDLDTHNLVTVSDRGGGDATAEDSTSPLGTQDPPNGVGEARQTVNVNLDDPASELPQHANWWLRRGTVNLPRYPQLTVDLNAKPSLVAAVEAVEVGEVIEITGFREYTIRLIVLGWTETIGTHTRTITFTCAPDQQFVVGKWDATDSRWDAKSTTTDGSLNTTDTWIGLATSNLNEAWSWAGVPYPILVAGEEMTVLGMSRPDSIALADGTFEKGIGFGWNASNCTAVDSTTRAHTGAHSTLLTVVGSPVEATLRANLFHAASPGQTFTSWSWVYSVAGGSYSHHIDWYNGVTFLSRNGTTVAVPAATWTLISVSATAPASTTRLEYGPSMGGSPVTGTQIWVDDVECLRTDVHSNRQLALVDRSLNGIVKSQAAGAAVHVKTPGRWAL